MTFSWMRKTYNAGGIGPAVVEAVVKRWFRCCEMGYDRVSSAVGTPRHARQRMAATKTEQKTYKRVTMPRRRRARQPRLMRPRRVNIVPESLRISRRGSGLWRSSSGSGLSILQFEGSADRENYGRKKRVGHRQRLGGDG